MAKLTWGTAALGAVLCAGTQAQAQVFTPSYQSPTLVDEAGVHVSGGPGAENDLVVEGMYRRGRMGFRAGYIASSSSHLSLGTEVRVPLTTRFPAAVVGSVQGLIGYDKAVGFELGITTGKRFVTYGVAYTPFLHPRLAAIDGLEEHRFRYSIITEAGANIELPGHSALVVSIGGLGDAPEVGMGFVLRP
ncbi:hypothetical protein [Longimicrobium terrae]|uniref:Outer membrane protein beta-barrel domain-containing protein n=1 Tax=Longimicrobium terrae TaxID=1639882 RepID=A0A841GMB8_9BACT|nr:hypothetical protein [Longimicrobium terrae]MBB4635537.1 hypothetical protein [Longimicrobium terrae]MBB6069931.1 hypothetical protein [Longimicrobium terrae]NNC32844.1 hypothetical protein [Longimicrobium terrae]